MNAKFLEQLVVYRQTQGLACAQLLLSQKVKYQFTVVGERKAHIKFVNEIEHVQDIADLLLVEARAARLYWHKFGRKIQHKVLWLGRQARRKDPVNSLLDIGYHYLTQKIIKMCQEINLPTELGIFHKAQSGKAHPLVYDLIEPWRPILVDDVLLKIMGKKKKQIETIDKRTVAYSISRIRKKEESYYFHRQLGYCITLNYWIRLMLLEFMSAIHSDKSYHPLFPSTRHESRCKQKPLS